MYQYRCTVKRWLDGDTVDLSVDLGFYATLSIRARVYGLNTPEVHTTSQKEKNRGLAAKAFAEHLAPVGKQIEVESAKDDKELEKYGRWLARITLADGRDFAKTMITNGYGKEYFGGKRA